MSWSSRKEKERIFCTVYFEGNFFQNIHTFAYQKPLLHTLLLLVFNIVERLQCNLNKNVCQYQQKPPEKQELTFFRLELFHIKTKVCVKYSVNGCRSNQRTIQIVKR